MKKLDLVDWILLGVTVAGLGFAFANYYTPLASKDIPTLQSAVIFVSIGLTLTTATICIGNLKNSFHLRQIVEENKMLAQLESISKQVGLVTVPNPYKSLSDLSERLTTAETVYLASLGNDRRNGFDGEEWRTIKARLIKDKKIAFHYILAAQDPDRLGSANKILGDLGRQELQDGVNVFEDLRTRIIVINEKDLTGMMPNFLLVSQAKAGDQHDSLACDFELVLIPPWDQRPSAWRRGDAVLSQFYMEYFGKLIDRYGLHVVVGSGVKRVKDRDPGF